jgi:hypothetical protein
MESVFVDAEVLEITINVFFWKVAEDGNLSLFVTPYAIRIAHLFLDLRNPAIDWLLRSGQCWQNQEKRQKQDSLHSRGQLYAFGMGPSTPAQRFIVLSSSRPHAFK